MKIYFILIKIFTINLIFLPKIIISRIEEDDNPFQILKKDKDFNKPMIKLNAEFELIKMKNGMIGLLINDLCSTFSHIHFGTKNGYFTDSLPSLSHLAEHMIFQGSENYKMSFPIVKTIGGMKVYYAGSITGQIDQEYFYTIPYNFKFE